MLKKIILIAALLMVLLTGAVYAVQDTTQPLSQTQPQIKAKEPITEAEAYKMLFQNEKDTNSKTLSSVYSFIGTIASIFFVFLGANFLYNTRVRKGEFEVLHSDYSRKFEELNNNVLKNIEDKYSLSIDNLRKELDGKYILFSETQNQQIKAMNDAYNLQINSMNGSFEVKFDQIKSDTARGFKGHENEIKGLRANMVMQEALTNFENKVWSNAVRMYSEAAIIQLEINSGLAEKSIGKVIEILETVQALDTFNRGYINKMLAVLTEDKILYRVKIEDLLRRLPVK